MGEKAITIKINVDADTGIEKLQEIVKLLQQIKELSQEVFNINFSIDGQLVDKK